MSDLPSKEIRGEPVAYRDDDVSDRSDNLAIEGDILLNAVYDFLGRFVAYPSVAARVAHTLWVAHCHAMEAWESTPRIAFLSPEPGSGKTRALEITETLVERPVEAINTTPAYLFRKISSEEGAPTILYDEIDTIFGPKAQNHEEVRAVLNAGHRRGAVAGRCVARGQTIVTEELPAYCAVAMAGLGYLPDTLMARSVVIRMRRRAPDEAVQPYRRRVHAVEGNKLRDQLAAWATSKIRELMNAWPDMPDEIQDRNADVWEALFAVADAAGADWPKRARVAAVALVAHSQEDAPSLGVQLLTDLRVIFAGHEFMLTEDVLAALNEMDESPWADLRGKPLDSRRLARYLRQYDVKSKQARTGERVRRGYEAADLADPWARYLGPSPGESATPATPATVPLRLVSQDGCLMCGRERGDAIGWTEDVTRGKGEQKVSGAICPDSTCWDAYTAEGK